MHGMHAQCRIRTSMTSRIFARAPAERPTVTTTECVWFAEFEHPADPFSQQSLSALSMSVHSCRFLLVGIEGKRILQGVTSHTLTNSSSSVNEGCMVV